MKTVIIGGNSFLARHIRSLLPADECHSLSRLSQPSYSFPDQSIDQLKLDISGTANILYCAGAGVQPGHKESDELIWSLNYHEPKRLIQRLNEIGYSGQLITFGSYFEIGVSYEDRAYSEVELITHQNTLPNAYTLSKHRFTQFVHEQLQHGNSFKHTHFILTNIYGIGENGQRLLPYLAQQFKAKAPIHLTSGDQKRQYTHVRDVAKFIVERVISAQTEGIFNLTNPLTLRVKDAVITFCEVAEADLSSISFSTAQRSDTAMPYLALDTQHTDTVFGPMDWTKLDLGLREYLSDHFISKP